ncbi:unnamed protein product [Lactuca saligna]|uniref:Uncharacterized protein n=1 Tax=Lactuca saligna TaxID=75948 RepID=A0AA35ZCN4_LACSI|nr:unnamed protein product [Lactuca saligna]
MGELSRMVMLAWLLDFRKGICRNDLAPQLSYMADPYLIELSIFIGISDRFSLPYPISPGTNKLYYYRLTPIRRVLANWITRLTVNHLRNFQDEGTSGLLPDEKLEAELEVSDSEFSLEPTNPLNLYERDEDENSEEEPNEDPEEEPDEDPDEELEEDPEEEPEGNHVDRGFYWEQLYKEETPHAHREIHKLKRNIEEIDEHRSRLVHENQIRVEATEESKRKIQRLEKEVMELRKPTITKLWEGFVVWVTQVNVATYGFLDRVVRRDLPRAEDLVIQSGPGDRKAKNIRKYLKEGK